MPDRSKNLIPAIRTNPVPLSGRLEAIVEMAGAGNIVCDVGCDHAHVPIRLLQEGKFAAAIGMDVLPGPLEKARGNLELYGMPDRVELRQSDGLDAYIPGEADLVILTGMGGTLMRDILLRDPRKTGSIPCLLLGPQSDPDLVRAALRRTGFAIEDERLVLEDGKYYPVIRARNSPARINTDIVLPADKTLQSEAEDLFGPVLLSRRDPVLREYLVRQYRVLQKIYRDVSDAAEHRTGETEINRSLRQQHQARKIKIEHRMRVFEAALAVFSASLTNTGDF